MYCQIIQIIHKTFPKIKEIVYNQKGTALLSGGFGGWFYEKEKNLNNVVI